MLSNWNRLGLGDFSDLNRSFLALNELRREMDRIFEGVDKNEFHSPRFELVDAGSELRLRAELPGLGEKDISITLEQSTLTIRGERKPDSPEGYAVHRQERRPFSFARSFSLPSKVDPEKVSAKLKDGILELTLEKAAEERPRQIQVQTTN